MKHVIFILLVFSSYSGYTQTRKHNTNDQIFSLNWDVIGSVKFELTEKNQLIPVFSETIKRFENKAFDLKGYIVPLKSGQRQQKFLLATLPVNQCFFCGQNGIPVMIMVEMDEVLNYTDKPVQVKGILKLERKDASYAPPISIKNAKLII